MDSNRPNQVKRPDQTTSMANLYPTRKISFAIALLVSMCSLQSQAQYDFTMQGMTLVPQRTYINPAFIPDSKWHIGIPGISSNHITAGFSPFKYSKLIQKDANDSLYVDLQSALDRMSKTGYLSINANIDLLSFSFTFGSERKNFMYVNITERIATRFTLPHDLLNMIWKGNAEYLGETIDLKRLNVNASHYREYAITYARKLLDDKLRLGLTAKYLYGMENLSTDNRELTLFTDGNNYNITATSDFSLNSTGIFSNDLDQLSDDITGYLFKRKNHGFALNVGAHYMIDDNWEVAASVSDLGYIFWNEQPVNYSINDADFTFQGLDLASYITNATDSVDVFQEFVDTLTEVFDIQETNDRYRTSVPSKMYISGAYKFTDRDRLGLDFYGEFFKGHFEPAVALNYTHKFGTIFHLSSSYMYNNRSFANFGLGFGLTLGPIQWYFAMDNILGPIWPQATQNVHFHSGLNLVFKYKDKKISDRDGDGIIDKLDDCPDEFGLEVFAGCPDRDLDSIPDKKDDCPDKFGPKENKGCPWGDKDGDGILDNEDDCPDVPGPVENNGCPWGDIDGDGVTDNIDDCDTIPGPAENNGCPWGDRDGDGVLDNVDKCPDTPGPAENDGCPWGDRDGDGVLDNEDRCPDIPGPVDNDGCPYQDSDGDGVIDIEDECPRTPGPVANKGCPVIEKEEQEVLNTAFENLEFETGSDVIRSSSYESLDELSGLLNRKEEYKLKISGHTDDVGSADSNKRLSERRSKSVQRYLTGRGIAGSRFVVEWFGESQPKYPNDTPTGRQKNRRVEMEVVFE